MTNEEAIEELRDASDCEVRYGDKDNHYDKVMKRVEAFEMAIKALERKNYKSEARRWKRRYLDLKAKEKEWLQTFNTDSATECFTAVQRLKESVNACLDEGYAR